MLMIEGAPPEYVEMYAVSETWMWPPYEEAYSPAIEMETGAEGGGEATSS
jgi:hypothetical protein